jgi:PUA domain protein
MVERVYRVRRTMRRREAREFLEEASSLFGEVDSGLVEEAELDDETLIYLIDGSALFARRGGNLFPLLTSPAIDRLPSIYVDMGAVPHICKGADVMIPGIVEVEEDFREGSLVTVRDVRHRKALSIGRALLPSDEIKKGGRGRAVENLHHVGDKIWRTLHS